MPEKEKKKSSNKKKMLTKEKNNNSKKNHPATTHSRPVKLATNDRSVLDKVSKTKYEKKKEK